MPVIHFDSERRKILNDSRQISWIPRKKISKLTVKIRYEPPEIVKRKSIEKEWEDKNMTQIKHN